MSKHAIEAYTDVLAIELASLGVEVAVVEPGNYKSDIMESMVERMRESGYAPEGSMAQDQNGEGPLRAGRSGAVQGARWCAAAYLDFLTSEKPKRRYMVVPNEREAEFTIRAHIRRLVQLNADQPYTFTSR